MKAKLSWLTSWICQFRTYSKKSSPTSSAKPTAIGRRPVSFMFRLSTSVGSSLFEPDSWCRLIGLRTPLLGQCQHTREGIKAASSFPGAECFDLRPYRDCAKIRRLTLWLETRKEDPLSLVYHGRRTRWHRHLSIDQRSSVSLSVVLSSSCCWTHCLSACSTCPPTLCNWPCGRSLQQMQILCLLYILAFWLPKDTNDVSSRHWFATWRCVLLQTLVWPPLIRALRGSSWLANAAFALHWVIWIMLAGKRKSGCKYE